MTVIVSIIIGFTVGCFINYAITFRTGAVRNLGLCVAGALLGGALIPALLSVSSVGMALIGSVVGIAAVLLAWLMVAPTRA